MKAFVARDALVITVLVSAYVSKIQWGYAPPSVLQNSSPHTSPMDDVSYPWQELESMTTTYMAFIGSISSGG